MKRAIILWFLILSVSLPTAARGDDILQMDAAETMAITDKNGDDHIDRGEYHNRMTEVFFFIDTDKSGDLTKSEIDEVETIDPDKFEAADTDDSHTLTISEYLNALYEDFTRADSNNDGLLDIEELRHMMENNTKK